MGKEIATVPMGTALVALGVASALSPLDLGFLSKSKKKVKLKNKACLSFITFCFKRETSRERTGP